MNTLNISNHAVTRMNQRGLRHSDLDLILRCGSEGYVPVDVELRLKGGVAFPEP